MKILKLIRRLWCKCKGYGQSEYKPIGQYRYGSGHGRKKCKCKYRYDILYTWKCEKCGKVKDSYKVRYKLTEPQMHQYMNRIKNSEL